MSIKMIAIDLDGTLLNPELALNPATITAVQAATAQGIHVVLCSGRPLAGVHRYLKPLGLTRDTDLVVAYNGALIQSATGTVLAKHGLSHADYVRLLALADDIGVHEQSLDETRLYTHNRDISEYTVREAYIMQMPLFYRQPEDFASDHDFVKVMFIDDPAVLAAGIAKIPAAVQKDYYFVRSHPFFLEVLNRAVNKGNAVQTAAAHWGLARDQVMAIGDEANDVPMFDAAGLSVAMVSAPDSVKAKATAVTATNAEDGVAQAIEKYVLH